MKTADEPTIVEPTDAVIRLSATCVCGSDLWPYRGIEKIDGPSPMGHEYAGIVEQVGSDVTTVKPGQFVIGSFFASDNTCAICDGARPREHGHRRGGRARCGTGQGRRPGVGAVQPGLRDVPQLQRGLHLGMPARQPDRSARRGLRLPADGGVVGVYEPEDEGAATEDAQQGRYDFDYGTAFTKGITIRSGQCPVKKYNRRLRDLIIRGRARPSQIVSHELSLEEAVHAYDQFDKRVEGWTEVLLHPAAAA
jgi:threonine dehydrogenase-like Zn-dependent dehydrogenase